MASDNLDREMERIFSKKAKDGAFYLRNEIEPLIKQLISEEVRAGRKDEIGRSERKLRSMTTNNRLFDYFEERLKELK